MDLPIPKLPTPLQVVVDDTTREAEIVLYIKRDDLIHPSLSGNKWRKLRYILTDARAKGFTRLLTFGGARSNHLYATAAAGALYGFQTIGVVRGEEYQHKETDTLQFCREQGMHLLAIPRSLYRQKDEPDFLNSLLETYQQPYLIPEGGAAALALPGVRELVGETVAQLGARPDYFAVAAGTGTTAAGLLSEPGTAVLAFASLKGGAFLEKEIRHWVEEDNIFSRLTLLTDYHFGGYARYTAELLYFMEQFENRHNIPLEHVYTGKMLFGLYDLMKKGYFKKGSILVAVHTGGLQGKLTSLT